MSTSSETALDSGAAGLRLGVSGFSWADLQKPGRLAELHELFLGHLEVSRPDAAERFASYRASLGAGMTPEHISAVLVEIAPFVGEFVARLFGVEEQRRSLLARAETWAPIFKIKDRFIKRRALKRGEVPFDAAIDAAARKILAEGFGIPSDAHDDEIRFAEAVAALLDLEAELKKNPSWPERAAPLRSRLASAIAAADDASLVAKCLETFELWVAMRKKDAALAGWMTLRQPQPVDFEKLVPQIRSNPAMPEMITGPEEHRRHRDGFRLTDPRMNAVEVADQVAYCLYCHERNKDSCSKGFPEPSGGLKKNPIGIPLPGCPLDEKVSEAHIVKRAGDSIGAVALVAIDNPMMPGTGHRICNDCMKACIFQKQDPVNIPQIETGILTDVLEMPWGFEIFSFLTRWNPLNVRRPYPVPYHGKNVLVVGLGPAGYTLAHHLLNEGFGVVGVDGLKIEPLPRELLENPIRDLAALRKELDERVSYGFGGVSEYGITVRWDKNFLTVIYLTLARREKARFYGGVRFGGTLTLEDAWEIGIDHVALASGAGKPTIIDLENNLIRGIRKASDFLMGLQLGGAFKKGTLGNLQVRLPAVVIGGGLTAIDTATELRAYYIVQIEKILARHESVSAEIGEDKALVRYDREERLILDEMLAHGRAARAEREAAAREARPPNFDDLIDRWGGVSLAYRKRLLDCPAYRLNHEEIIKCLEEGVRFIENVTPKGAIPDEFGALTAVTFTRPDGTVLELPARSLMVAAGTSPNTIYEKEHPGTFRRQKNGYFEPHRAVAAGDGKIRVEPGGGFFTSYLDDAGHTVSYYGDNHPKYAGSVVKAMASAKDGFRAVEELFRASIASALAEPAQQPERERRWTSLARKFDDEILATVVAVNRLTPIIVEVVVRAPMQSRKFHPGQFYRLQNYETLAPEVDGTRLMMEGIALTGAWVDPERGLLALIVLEMGGSSRLCAALRPGEAVVVMGPTGTPTEIPKGETVVLAGGGLGNAVLFSIAKALREAGNKVVYFAGYKKPEDIFKREEIESSTDEVVWSADVPPAIEPHRPGDRAFVGNIVESMHAFASGALGPTVVRFADVDRIIAIGSDRMMSAVTAARHGVLAPYLRKGHVGIGSINSPMQCMMKEVCAQCLQIHRDSVTGEIKEIVFSCFNQDQPLDEVDWKNLNDRLRQNTVQEKLANLWLDRIARQKPDLMRV